MNKDLEQLSALYDGELSREEIHEGLKKMNEDPRMKETFHKFGLISELVQRKTQKKIFKGIIFKRPPQKS